MATEKLAKMYFDKMAEYYEVSDKDFVSQASTILGSLRYDYEDLTVLYNDLEDYVLSEMGY